MIETINFITARRMATLGWSGPYALSSIALPAQRHEVMS